MLYDTCNYHILHYSKLIIVHPITTVLIVNLTSKRMNNSMVSHRGHNCISSALTILDSALTS